MTKGVNDWGVRSWWGYLSEKERNILITLLYNLNLAEYVNIDKDGKILGLLGETKLIENIKVLGKVDTCVEDAVKQNFPNYKYMIYDYHSEPYEGHGSLIVKTQNNQYYFRDLGHCSCYGPADGISDFEKKLYNSIIEIEGSEGWFEQFKSVIEEMEKLEQKEETNGS